MTDDQGSRQAGQRRCEARTEAGMKAAAGIMDLPNPQDPSQVLLPGRNQEIQALATQVAEEALAIGICHGHLWAGVRRTRTTIAAAATAWTPRFRRDLDPKPEFLTADGGSVSTE
jgi:hypothetical protein